MQGIAPTPRMELHRIDEEARLTEGDVGRCDPAQQRQHVQTRHMRWIPLRPPKKISWPFLFRPRARVLLMKPRGFPTPQEAPVPVLDALAVLVAVAEDPVADVCGFGTCRSGNFSQRLCERQHIEGSNAVSVPGCPSIYEGE